MPPPDLIQMRNQLRMSIWELLLLASDTADDGEWVKANRGEPMQIGDIAHALGTPESAVYANLRLLESAGLIRRRRSASGVLIELRRQLLNSWIPGFQESRNSGVQDSTVDHSTTSPETQAASGRSEIASTTPEFQESRSHPPQTPPVCVLNPPAENSKPEGARDIKPGKGEYTPEFETAWATYARKIEKRAGFRCWRTSLNQGATVEQLTAAIRRYSDHCRELGTPQGKIKHLATFLGPDAHWREWVERVPEGAARPNEYCRPTGVNFQFATEKKDDAYYEQFVTTLGGGARRETPHESRKRPIPG